MVNIDKNFEDRALESVRDLLLDTLPKFVKKMFILVTPHLTDLQAKITFGQIHVLHELGQRDLVSMSELANIFKVSLPSMTETIDKLVKLNLVERVADQNDRRLVLIRLSSEGNKTWQNIRAARENAVKQLTEKLSSEDIETVMKMESIFKKMVDSIEEK